MNESTTTEATDATQRRRLPACRSYLAATAAIVAIAGTLVSVLLLAGVDVESAFGAIPLRIHDPLRPALVAAAATVLWLVAGWRSHFLRATGLTCVVLLAAVALCMVARRGPQAWPNGDGALIELYTLYATRGQQLTGAYSQFGWHHPGPALFYLLTPFYVLGGRSVHALNAGAFAIDLAALAAIGWALIRRRDRSPVLGIGLCALLLLFVARVPPLLTSAWNPHIPVLPFAALLVTASAAATGDFWCLPIAALLASFAAQAHIGLVPVSVAVLASALAGAWWFSRNSLTRASMMRWGTISFYVLVVAWLLPIAEQIVNTPGNITLVARYFVADTRSGQPTAAAWGTTAEALTSAFGPGFQVPQGWVFARAGTLLAPAAGTLAVLALLPALLKPRREPDGFQRALAAIALMTTVVGFWSILRIRESVADHAVFWLSALGLVVLAAAAGGLADAFASQLRTGVLESRVVPAAAVVLIVSSAVIGYRQLLASQERPAARDETTIAVQVLSDEAIRTMRQAGIGRPLLQMPDRWEVGVGMALQMSKEPVAFSVDPAALSLVGRSLAPRGDEDAVFTVAGPALHEQLAARPGNILVGRSRSVFVDGIRVSK